MPFRTARYRLLASDRAGSRADSTARRAECRAGAVDQCPAQQQARPPNTIAALPTANSASGKQRKLQPDHEDIVQQIHAVGVGGKAVEHPAPRCVAKRRQSASEDEAAAGAGQRRSREPAATARAAGALSAVQRSARSAAPTARSRRPRPRARRPSAAPARRRSQAARGRGHRRRPRSRRRNRPDSAAAG